MKKTWFNKNILGFSLASFFGDWCHEMTTAILPMFIAQIIGSHYAPLVVGTIQGIANTIAMIAKLLSGWLADRVASYKPFLIIGYGLVSLAIALIGTTSSIILIFLYKIVAWFAKGLREPMRDVWIARIVPASLYGRAFGFHRASDTIGALIGPVCTFLLLKTNYNLSSIFYLSLIPGICSVLAIIFITSEEKNNSSAKEAPRFFVEDIKNLPARFIFFVWIMLLFGLGNFNPMMLIYRVQTILGQTQAAMIATTQGVLLYVFFNSIRAISEFSIGLISDYYNRRLLLALCGFGFFGVTSIGCMYETTNIWFWIFIFGCAGFSLGAVKTLEKSYSSYILPTNIRGTGLGVLQSIEGIGNLISNVIIGVFWMKGYAILGFGYSAFLSFLAMILLLVKK